MSQSVQPYQRPLEDLGIASRVSESFRIYSYATSSLSESERAHLCRLLQPLSFGTVLFQTLCTASSRLGVLKVAGLQRCIVTMERTNWPSYGLMLLRFSASRFWLLAFWVVVLGCCCCPPQAGAFVRVVPTKPTKISGGGVHVRLRARTLLPSKMSLQTPPKQETGKAGVPGKDEKTNDQPGIATSLQPKATSTTDDGARSAIVSEQDRNSEALKQRLLIGVKDPEEQDVMWKLKVRLLYLSHLLCCLLSTQSALKSVIVCVFLTWPV